MGVVNIFIFGGKSRKGVVNCVIFFVLFERWAYETDTSDIKTNVKKRREEMAKNGIEKSEKRAKYFEKLIISLSSRTWVERKELFTSRTQILSAL